MVRSIGDYLDVVGDDVVSSLYKKASRLYEKHICNINSTFLGGGVAEILSRLVPLANDVGTDMDWRVIHGNPAFFDVTKSFHNALQGGDIDLTEKTKNTYLRVNKEFSRFAHLESHECVIVHDPQPLPLIEFYKKQEPWAWRCHIDISNPNQELWKFLKKFMIGYDMIIVSSESFKKADLPVEQRIIHPAIDPLSLKNIDLSEEEVLTQIKAAGIPTDKPIVTQVSRMDIWKDPEGVMEAFKLVKEKVDCRLLYCFNVATDDPEGVAIHARVCERAKDLIEAGDVIFVLGNDELLVNAVQRFSTVVLQKSIKEGFALTVTEALWKGKPVIAGNVGGIPTQITDGENGYLVDPYDYKACADRIVGLLKDPKLSEEMGRKAKERVRKNFLITRLVSDYLDLVTDLLK
ncbi:MAG: glycosyltransferase [Candidatus Omnitrophota bacterium]